jgi:hypothetical protein
VFLRSEAVFLDRTVFSCRGWRAPGRSAAKLDIANIRQKTACKTAFFFPQLL